MPNRNLGRIALVATLLLAATASADEEQGEVEVLVYARPGFYVGVGGSYGSPVGWDSDFDNDPLEEEASDLANQNAMDDLETRNPPPSSVVVPLAVMIDGADLEDGLLGVNGVIGYRAGERVAFEVEAEWLVGSNKSNLDVAGSVGSHTTEIEEIWTLTANVRMFLPTDWRVQPSVIVGLGLQHSKLDVDLVTEGLETVDSTGTFDDLDADFELDRSRTKLTGALRVGAGIDFYATPNIVGQLNATYVLPFNDVGSVVTTDYMSLVWRLVYRF